jgi:hypothetical protein
MPIAPKKIDVKKNISSLKEFIKYGHSNTADQGSLQQKKQYREAIHHLNEASNFAMLRASIPPHLQRRFIFRISKKINVAIVKCFNLLFFDQKKVNNALIQSQQCALETITLLSKEVTSLSMELKETQLALNKQPSHTTSEQTSHPGKQ